jgi:hypothetical protein
MRRRERSAASRSTEAREASSPRAPIARAETTTPRGAREEAVAARPRSARETSRAPATRVVILEAAPAAPEVVIAIVGDIDDRARVLSESTRLALAEPPPGRSSRSAMRLRASRAVETSRETPKTTVRGPSRAVENT